MDDAELVETLMGLAEEAGLEVRVVGASELDATTTSAVCKVRGNVWVVLASGDPTAVQIEVLCRALREHGAEFLEGRFLPPAVRERLGGAGSPGG